MASWKNRPIRRGLTWCGDCCKWKAHKAFVRSYVRRGSEKWEQNGYIWKRFKRCNKCTRIYYYKGMSATEFVQEFGAEEHNDSEPEILEGEIEEIKSEDVKSEGAESKHVFKRIKLNFKRPKIEDDDIQEISIDRVSRIKRIKVKGVKIEGDKPEGDKPE